MAEDKQGERVEIDCPECGSKAYYGNGAPPRPVASHRRPLRCATDRLPVGNRG